MCAEGNCLRHTRNGAIFEIVSFSEGIQPLIQIKSAGHESGGSVANSE